MQPPRLIALDRLLALISLTWLMMAAITLILGFRIDQTALGGEFPLRLRWALTAWELELGAITIAAVSIGATLIGASAARFTRPTARIRRVLDWAVWSMVSILAALYAGSWVSLIATGRFFDLDGLRFVAMNPIQFFQHAFHLDVALVIAFPLLAGTLAWGLGSGIPCLLSRLDTAGRWIVSGCALVGMLGCLVLSPGEPAPKMALGTNGRAPILIDPEGGLISDFESAFKAERDDRAGPLAHLWAQWRGDLGGVMPEYPDPEIETVQRPLVSTGEYVAGVDPDRVKKLNVIVVVIESLRPDQLVAFGGSRPVMDRVDALAASGRIFPNTYSQASHSNYADPCIFSSAYPLRSPDVHVYPENPTYPRLMLWDILKALGWHTAVISSQNEHWGGMINYLQTDGIDHFFHSESFTGATYVPRDDIGFFAFVKTGRRSGKIDDRFTVDEAVRWIQTLPSGEPFMIYLNLQNSHIPYETPADFPHRYGPVDRPFSIHFGGFPRSGIQVVKDLYADSLAYVDFQLGRLLDFIQSQGIADRTLVVVTGDTGQAFYEHGFVAHANMVFDEEMRVPLIFNGSGISPGEDRRPAQHIDVAPTVLDALGLPPHPAFQGISLLETEPSPARSRFLMAHSPLAHQYAVVRGGFKLIYDVPTGRTVLYNVVEDPGEKHDLAPSMPNLTRSLRGRLDAWRQHQLDYYHDAARQARFYPPVLVD